ncbi:MAG: helix-turn-helix domain-containing protein [Chlamydiota bacterium]|nr:helix-turn-helix domain-containing protein [Chlamydiota bacterium]
MKNNDVLTLNEASKYLRISVYALGDLAREKKIPCFKVGRMWRFRKSSLEKWMEKQEKKSR